MQAQHGGHKEEGKDAVWDAPGSAGRLSEPSPSREGSVPSPICLPVPPFLSVGFPATRWSSMEGDGDGEGSQEEEAARCSKRGIRRKEINFLRREERFKGG